ncbi:MAG: L-rhamnose/proton symporter RhaT [Alistipes ihumii]
MRYLGVALGQSISLGTCAGFGTLLPAIFAGTNLFQGEGLILLVGVCITLAGIAVIGYAGSLRSKNMTEEEKKAAIKDFALTKGLLVALLAGVMSACFALGLDAGAPIKEAALSNGVKPLFAGLPVILLVTFGGFLTNAAYCIQQNVKNHTGGDYFSVPGSVWSTICFSALWPAYCGTRNSSAWKWARASWPTSPLLLAFSWSILMSLNVTFSNVWGILLKEWKVAIARRLPYWSIGLVILVFSVFAPSLMNMAFGY